LHRRAGGRWSQALEAGSGWLDAVQVRDIWWRQKLAAAVLEVAAVDLLKYRYARGRSSQRVYWQAYQWVASSDREWPMSFINICDYLDLSPQALRARLLTPASGGVGYRSGLMPDLAGGVPAGDGLPQGLRARRLAAAAPRDTEPVTARCGRFRDPAADRPGFDRSIRAR
jgi:hypothetical protein